MLGKNFDGDGAIEAGVSGFVDFAHTARADRREDLIRTEPASRCYQDSCTVTFHARASMIVLGRRDRFNPRRVRARKNVVLNCVPGRSWV